MSENKVSVKNANPEQRLAIESGEGAHLEAGAGSGKTFVIVEHLVFLAKKFVYEQQHLAREALKKAVRDRFSSIVLMTFTKKAAAEITQRVRRRFQQVDFVDQDIAQVFLDSVTITTIHGLCSKLIKMGLVESAQLDFDLSSSLKIKSYLRDIFEQVLEEEKSLLPDNSEQHYRNIIHNERSLFQSILEIFNDAHLKKTWLESTPAAAFSLSLEKFLAQWLELNELQQLFSGIPSSAHEDAFKKLAWAKLLQDFSTACPSAPQNLEDLKKALDFFQSIKQLRGPNKKTELTEVFSYFDKLKVFRDFLREQTENLEFFYGKGQEEYLGLLELVKKIVLKIEAQYQAKNLMSFSDLEFQVDKALSIPAIAELVRQEFSYFIVDEFQDTSSLQFKIIEALIGGDYRRAFFVGDSKQAIYRFRGGELEVFYTAKKLAEERRVLKNNYRSEGHLIHFTNEFFSRVLGPMDFVPQSFPEERAILGEAGGGTVARLTLSDEHITPVLEQKIITSKTADYFEAQLIGNHIQEQFAQGVSEIAVLYKNLRPSQYLLNFLIKHNLGFTAQVKLSYSENPLVGVFETLMQAQFLSAQAEVDLRWPEFMVRNYLLLLELPINSELKMSIESFLKNSATFGYFSAFILFLQEMSLSFGNFTEEIKLIRELCQLSAGDAPHILRALKDNGGESFSAEFRFGNHSDKIKIMTVHASKGLEFEEVILAGIYSNGREKNDFQAFGKHLGSARWKSLRAPLGKVISPRLVLEKEQSRILDLAESKRLFYVAATRAKKQLTWVDFPEAFFETMDASWAQEFRNHEILLETLVQQNKKMRLNLEVPRTSLELRPQQIPFPLKTPMGILPKVRLKSENIKTVITSELSVTKLANFIECPRKFFLKSICHFDQDEMNLFGALMSWGPGPKEELKTAFYDEGPTFELPAEKKSSMGRGTLIHQKISELLGAGVTEVGVLSKDQQGIAWVWPILQEAGKKFQLVSEMSLKFPFREMMIAGTPDLILLPKIRGSFEIWDFKTGGINPTDQDHYWFQLMVYAHAVMKLELASTSSSFSLKLVYLDEQKIVEKKFDQKSLEQSLNIFLGNFGDYTHTNLKHCPRCPYQNLCHPKIQGLEAGPFVLE